MTDPYVQAVEFQNEELKRKLAQYEVLVDNMNKKADSIEPAWTEHNVNVETHAYETSFYTIAKITPNRFGYKVTFTKASLNINSGIHHVTINDAKAYVEEITNDYRNNNNRT